MGGLGEAGRRLMPARQRGPLNGHRRISRELVAQYKGRPDLVMCLLELDEDSALRGRLRSIRTYARLWDVSRKRAATLIAKYMESLENLYPESGGRKRGQQGDSRGTLGPRKH